MKKTDRIAGRKDELLPAEAFGTFLFFIFIFLVTHEVTIQDSLELCGTFTLDLITGTMLWILISRKQIYAMSELFGVGVVLGTTIPAIIGLLTRGSVIYSSSSYLFSALTLFMFVYKRNLEDIRVNIIQTNAKKVLAVCAIALLLISGDAAYQWSGVFSLVSCISLIFFAEKKRFLFSHKWAVLIITNGSVFMSLMIMSIVEFRIYGKRTTTSYISGWDGVSYEARSKGLLNYGPFDNLWQSNLKFAYYWFADAWSGSLTSRSHASDWIVTTQFGYVVLALATVCLILTILSTKIPQPILCYVATAFVASTTMIGTAGFLFNLGSFSYTVSVVFLLLIIFLVNNSFINNEIRSLPVLCFAILLLVMTKTTIAAPVLTGLLIMGLFLISIEPRNRISQSFLATILLSSLGSVSLYYIFIRPEPANAGDYSKFKIGLVTNHFGINTNVIVLDIVLLALYKLIPVYSVFNSLVFKQKRFEITLLFISAMSVSSSLIIRTSSSISNTYFLTPFLILLAILAVTQLCNKLSLVVGSEELTKLVIIAALTIGFGSGLVATFGLQHYNFLNFFKTSYQIFLLSLPLLTGLVLVISVMLYSKKFHITSLNILLLFSTVVASSMSGSYVAQSMRSFQQKTLYSSRDWDPPFQDVEFELNRVQMATSFIVSELKYGDVLASNSVTDKGLLASLTGIRNYGTSYFPNLWSGEEHRYSAQAQYAVNPSSSNYEVLRDGCVTWFYYDKDDSLNTAKTFEPYATIMYEDEFGAVLKLSESYPIPESCNK